ncbi:response regulator [Fulvivirga lutimaris]|uniref:response regulator n=1 Tax=Fulvivirga lutimaris TaxID=1819566 RepID=UPI0012BC1252|nr:response regulator [Fulvivirga lutimaris]MTI40059.1 response regulator [Fulvivirga lutimaris]
MINVAIIDDNMILQMHLKKLFLTYSNIRSINSFTSVEDALEFFKETNEVDKLPDIILLDINFPGLDGWDFLDEFEEIKKNIEKEISIYMISSSIMDSDIEKSKAIELVKGFINKPISSSNLDDIKNFKNN